MRFKGRVKKKPSSAGVESDKAIRQEALLPRLCPAPPPGLASSLNLSLHCTFCPADSLTVRSSQPGTPQPPPAPLHCEPERCKQQLKEKARLMLKVKPQQTTLTLRTSLIQRVSQKQVENKVQFSSGSST